MSYNFPPNPKVGEVYTSLGRSWKWSGVSWQPAVAYTPKSSPVYISVSPPPDPVPGSLWYDSNNNILNIFYKNLTGSQWVAVVPYPDNDLDQNGGVFSGAIYAKYEIPNNNAAFITAGWFKEVLPGYLKENAFLKGGDGITYTEDGEIATIDSGIVV